MFFTSLLLCAAIVLAASASEPKTITVNTDFGTATFEQPALLYSSPTNNTCPSLPSWYECITESLRPLTSLPIHLASIILLLIH